jgi:hypothetical protein
MKSVVKPWLAERLSLKQQTVVLVALRGCDGLPKEDPSKRMVRALRGTVLENADPKTNFMDLLDDEHAQDFLGSLDHYPVHWLTHFMHAAEIIGYHHPQTGVSMWWLGIYMGIVRAIHLEPESKDQLDSRLRDEP